MKKHRHFISIGEIIFTLLLGIFLYSPITAQAATITTYTENAQTIGVHNLASALGKEPYAFLGKNGTETFTVSKDTSINVSSQSWSDSWSAPIEWRLRENGTNLTAYNFQSGARAEGSSILLQDKAIISKFEDTSTVYTEFNLVMPDDIKITYIESISDETEGDNKTYKVKFVTTTPRNIIDIGEIFGVGSNNANPFSYFNQVDLTLPYYTNKLADRAFMQNDKLRSLYTKNIITSIGSQAFYHCTALKNIDLNTWVGSSGSSLSYLPSDCFAGCTSLETLAIPTQIVRIDSSCFKDCTKLDTLMFHNKLTSIGREAFDNCTDLRYIYIGNTSIDWMEKNDSENFVDESKLICNAEAESTSPIVSKDGSDVNSGSKIYSKGTYTVISRVDLKDCTVYKDNSELLTSDYTSKAWGRTTYGKKFTISGYGNYRIVATDVAGNTIDKTIEYSREVNDVKGPDIKVTGSGGTNGYYSKAVISITDADTEVADMSLNGKTITNPNFTLTEEGEYTIVAYDAVRNKTEKKIVVDSTAPEVTEIENNGSYNRALTIKYSDETSGVKTVLLDGARQGNTGSLYVASTSKHTLVVEDNAGNRTTMQFVIDMIGPTSNLINENYYNADVDATFDSIAGIASITVVYTGTDNAQSTYQIDKATKFTKEGSYEVTLKDKLDNRTTYKFVIDKTAPVINGVKNGDKVGDRVNLKAVDTNMDKLVVGDRESGDSVEVSDDGTYTAVATDKAGNKTTLKFTIDSTLNCVSGIENGKIYKKKLTFHVKDNVQEVKINGKTKDKKTSYTLKKDGKYTIQVKSEKGSVLTLRVTIDRTKPTAVGVKNGGKFKIGTKVWAKDKASGLKEVKLDGKVIKKKTKIKKKGKHTLVITDKAGNKTTVKFTIVKNIKKTATVVINNNVTINQ